MTEQAALLTRKKLPEQPPRLRVLVVMHHQTSRSMLKMTLRAMNMVEDVVERPNVFDLEDVLNQYPFDCVLLGVDMPGVDIYQVTRSIRNHPTGARAGVIFVSADLNSDLRRKGIEVGVKAFLEWPFDINSLQKALRDSVGKVSTNYKDTLDKVRRIPFFGGFTDPELVRLLKTCHTRKFAERDFIFREGEQGDRLYVQISGLVDIEKTRESYKELLATLKAGDCFGEMALVDSQPRSADAVARTDCMVIEVNKDLFDDENDILALKLFRKIALLVTQKLRQSNLRETPV